MKQYTFQELNTTTGAGVSWYNNNTNNAAMLYDLLTISPFEVQEMPGVSVEERKTKILVKVAPEKIAIAFYLLMQAGEVRCFRDSRFEIDVELLNILRDNAIQYEII